MELRHLRYFLAVADGEHFTRAAEELHVSQPALSLQIQQLETELATPLFDRLGRRVRLNAAGRAFRDTARRVLRQVEDARAELADLESADRGEVRVGTVQTVNTYLIPDLVATYRRHHPAVTVRIEELCADDIETGLISGRLDLGLGFLPPRTAAIEGDRLFEEDLVLFAGPNHPLARRRGLSLSALDGQALILLPATFCTRRLIDHSLQRAGARPEVGVEMTSIEGILATVKASNAATILPALVSDQARRFGLVAIHLNRPAPRRTVGLLWLAGAHRSGAARALASAAGEAVRRKIVRQHS